MRPSAGARGPDTRRVGNVLVGALVGDGARRRAAIAGVRQHGLPPGLADAALRHGVPGFVHRFVRDAGVAGAGVEALGAARLAAVSSHLQAVRALRGVAGALATTGVEWLVVKGPVLAVVAYGDPAMRSYADLDVVVPPASLGPALAALEGNGAAVLDRNWSMLRDVSAGQVHIRMPDGGLVDLHWSLVYEESDRRSFAVPSFEVLAGNGRTFDIAGLAVPTLGPVDALVHLALHATRSGCERLVWLKDLERWIVAVDPDWDAVVRTARRWRTGPAVAFSLDAAARLLDARVPEAVIHELAPSRSWRWMGRAALAVAPPQVPGGRRSGVRRLVARSNQASPRASMAEMLRRGIAWSRHVGEGDFLRRWDDPGDPVSPWFPAGDRCAFLESLEDEVLS